MVGTGTARHGGDGLGRFSPCPAFAVEPLAASTAGVVAVSGACRSPSCPTPPGPRLTVLPGGSPVRPVVAGVPVDRGPSRGESPPPAPRRSARDHTTATMTLDSYGHLFAHRPGALDTGGVGRPAGNGEEPATPTGVTGSSRLRWHTIRWADRALSGGGGI
ncbi:hypothetical protein GCM10027294_30300 [Marinactinospora endophytica]